MHSVDCVVVGAGIIGLAVARALATAGHDTILIERNSGFGSETSSRNSEVIHAGLYYPAGSLKATTCVRGCELIYSYCERRRVPHRRCGKLIVAAGHAQLLELQQLRDRAGRNGVRNLEILDRSEAQALEPALECTGALLSPSTGIIDSHEFMLALLGDAERFGLTCAFRCAISRAAVVRGGVEIDVGGDEPSRMRCRWLINAGGLHAVGLATRLEGFPQQHVPPAFFAKGSYFRLAGRSPFNRLVYPVPEQGGLGVHVTLDLAGQARFGPDVEWVNTIDYSVNPSRASGFYAAIRKYWPGLPDGALQPAYSGIRPRIVGPGQPPADFRIDGPAIHGIVGVVNLFGIESPGLTASLAIAEAVAAIVAGE